MTNTESLEQTIDTWASADIDEPAYLLDVLNLAASLIANLQSRVGALEKFHSDLLGEDPALARAATRHRNDQSDGV